MAHSFSETRVQGIMVVVSIKTNIQSKMMNTTTMIPCKHVSEGISTSQISFLFEL